MALERVDDIHGGDGLPACVLGVGDGIADDSLKEDLEDATGLLVDEARDALDTTTASETADGGLGDALDVIPEDLAVTLGAALSESFPPFHVQTCLFVCVCVCVCECVCVCLLVGSSPCPLLSQCVREYEEKEREKAKGKKKLEKEK